MYNFKRVSFDSSDGRAVDCSGENFLWEMTEINRSLVRIRLEGFFFHFFFFVFFFLFFFFVVVVVVVDSFLLFSVLLNLCFSFKEISEAHESSAQEGDTAVSFVYNVLVDVSVYILYIIIIIYLYQCCYDYISNVIITIIN